VFLDAFPRRAEVIDRARVARHPRVITTMRADAQADLEAARLRLVSRLRGDAAFVEPELADLEEAGNRVAEIRRALDEGRLLRVAHELLLPARSALRPVAVAPSRAALAAALRGAVEREQAYGRAVQRLYAYHLVTRNCVSEILHELDTALLGQRGEIEGPSDFIPAASVRAVQTRYGTSEVVRTLSHRRAGLARLYKSENPLAVFLRESNTITSTLYQSNPRDSAFLFFTDDRVLTRPVFGAVNLLTGLGTSLAGVITAPIDGGRLLSAGLRGAVFSLPELFFQNIRKGSFEYVGHAADDEANR
jgi:hypothetical protein